MHEFSRLLRVTSITGIHDQISSAKLLHSLDSQHFALLGANLPVLEVIFSACNFFDCQISGIVIVQFAETLSNEFDELWVLSLFNFCRVGWLFRLSGMFIVV